MSFLAFHNRFDTVHGFFPCIVCAVPEQVLVLGFGEEISKIRRFQNRRKYFAFGKQSRSRVDGHVLFARFGHFEFSEIGRADVLSLMGSFDMQRAARSGFSVYFGFFAHYYSFE